MLIPFVPSGFTETMAVKFVKKLNDAPKVALKSMKQNLAGSTIKTTASSFLNEHLEELFGIAANYYLGANDTDTSVHQALGQYFKGDNLVLSSLNIIAVGGVMKAGTQFIAGEKTPLKTFSDMVIQTKLQKNGLSEKEAKAMTNNMTELQKQKYVELIFENEQQEQKERYYSKLNNLKQQIAKVQSEGYKAKWRKEAEENGLEFTKEQEKEAETKGQEYADYLINTYDAVYTQHAINSGESRESIMDKIEIELRFVDDENIEITQSAGDDIETFYKSNPTLKKNISDIVDEAKKPDTTNKKQEIGEVSDLLVSEAEKSNLDIKGYKHDIDTYSIKHIKNQHGDEKKEKARGQIAITDDDFKKIPYIINNFDYVIFGNKNNLKNDVIVYVKNMPDGSSIYVEEVRTGKKTLSTNTMYKKTGAVNSENLKSISKNSNAQSDTSSIRIIQNPNKNVKQNLSSDETLYQHAIQNTKVRTKALNRPTAK